MQNVMWDIGKPPLTPEAIFSAAVLAQVFYLLILGIGLLLVRGGSVHDSIRKEWIDNIGRATNKRALSAAYLLLLIGSLLLPVMADTRGTLIVGYGGFISPILAFHLMFTADVVVVAYLVNRTGGAGTSAFMSALTFIPTIILFLRQRFTIALFYGVLIVVALVVFRALLRRVDEKRNPQTFSDMGPAASAFMQVALLATSLFIAYRSLHS